MTAEGGHQIKGDNDPNQDGAASAKGEGDIGKDIIN